MKRSLCIALLMGLAACADHPETRPQQATEVAATPDAPVTCERISPTGSNRLVTRCAPAATAFDHMDARETVRDMAGPGAPAASPNGTGGH